MSDTETVLARDISRDQLLAELRALRPVFEREGVIHMTLFGSRARGDNLRDSDADLAVELNDARKYSLLDVIGISHILEDNLGLRADIYVRRSLGRYLANEVGRDGVEVF